MNIHFPSWGGKGKRILKYVGIQQSIRSLAPCQTGNVGDTWSSEERGESLSGKLEE
jgi:hypothetical protein